MKICTHRCIVPSDEENPKENDDELVEVDLGSGILDKDIDTPRTVWVGEEYRKVSLVNPKDMDKALVNMQRARAVIHRQLRRTEKQTLRVVTLCATRTNCLTTQGTQHLLCKTIVVATSGYTDTEHKHYRQLFNKIYAKTGM